MKKAAKCLDQRQHLNLSQYAYDTIKNDSLNFLETINISGFINRIVANSMHESFNDLILAEKNRLDDELITNGFKIDEQVQKTIEKIAKAHRNNLIRGFNKYPKDVTLKIRLQNDIHEVFYPDNSKWSGLEYGISQGEYIKSLLEEYARKTIYEREAIFYKDIIDDLNRYIHLETDKRILQITLTNNNKYYCKPYRLSENYEANYNYLIGISTKEGKSDYKINSFRISRIKKIKALGINAGSGKITKKEEKEINQRIKDSSVPYMLTKPNHYIIKLSEEGMKTYNVIYHKRPAYKNKPEPENGFYTLEIDATDRQISDYFHQFGKDAIIISPLKARKEFSKYYSEADNAYSE